jgi:cystathionine beta-lyase
MKYNFDEIRPRKNTAKWGMATQYGAIGMGVADMDFKLAPEIIEALKECAELGEFGYAGMAGSDYKAVTDWLEYRGETVPKDHLICTPGVLYSARAAMYMLTNPGDKVIVQTPLHTPSIATAAMEGRIPLKNKLKNVNGKYEIDFEDLENCFKQGAKVLMMCAPNNPTGRVWTMDELKQIAALVVKYNAYVVCDEIHRDIIWEGHKHISPTSLPELADRSIAVFSTSKSFNMGGFHIGTAIIPNPDLRERFKTKLYTWGHTCDRPSTLCQAAQKAAYNNARPGTRK